MTNFNDFAKEIHQENSHWWRNPATGEMIVRNVGEMIAIMHSELSEALEGVRKNKMDDHIPGRSSEEVEFADLLIRVFDYAGARRLDLDGAIKDKREYNKVRADHKNESRLASGGKQF